MLSNIPKAAYSVDEACELLSIGRTLLYTEIKAGRLRPVKCGRRTLIPHAELEAFIARLSGLSDHDQG